MITLVPRLSDAVDATKLSTMEYMYVRSTNKHAVFMGTTFTRISGEQLLAKVCASCCCRWWLFEPRGLLPLSTSVTVLIKTERTWGSRVRNTIQVSQRSSGAKQAHSGCVKMCCHSHDAIIGCKMNFVCKIFVVWGNHEIFLTTKISRSTVCVIVCTAYNLVSWINACEHLKFTVENWVGCLYGEAICTYTVEYVL